MKIIARYNPTRFLRINTFCFVLGLTSLLYGYGQNKVQYTHFDWNCFPAPHFNLYCHQELGVLPAVTYTMAEQIYRTLGKRFQFIHKDPVPIIIYGDPNLFSQTNVITEVLPEEVGGFTELFKTRVVVPFTGSYEEFNHVVHHEMIHAFQYGMFFNQGAGSLMAGGPQIPLWFMEGLAEYLSSGWTIESDMFLMDFTINSQVPLPGPELGGYMAYKGGQSFLFFLASTRGDSLFTAFLRQVKNSKSLENTVKSLYKKTTEELGKEWLQELKRVYWPEIGRRSEPERSAKAITAHLTTRDNYNLRPRISRDGKQIAFYSDRNDYTSILITDRKGKVRQEISQTGYGGYFESFKPFRSGLCWSPDGKRLAFVTKADGRDQIRIVHLSGRKLEQTIKTPLPSIAGPDWSPDGTSIVFTGVNAGQCDLYMYMLKTGTLKRLTENPAHEADPRFSPDGRSVIFSVEDSCTEITGPSSTGWGLSPRNLALYTIATGQSRLLTTTPWSKKHPAFSPAGDQVAFVSDRNGIDNIYLGSIDSLDHARPVTDFIGGCSNPDWSRKDSALVFTLFQKHGWDVWLMEKPFEKIVGDSLQKTRWVEAMTDSSRHYFRRPDQTAGRTADSTDAKQDTGKLSSGTAAGSRQTTRTNDSIAKTQSKVSAAFNDTAFSRPPPSVPEPRPYRLKFTPDMVGVGLGMSSFYGPAGQWLLSLSDIMGDHRITLAGDVQTDFKSTMHFFGSYAYLKNRIDLSGGAYYYKDYAFFSRSIFYFDAEFGAFLGVSYPFSLFSGLDFSLFGRNIIRTPIRYSDGAVDSSGKYSVNTILPSITYAYDNILWGITGPLNGTRAAVSVMAVPPLPSINYAYASFLGDYRKYTHLFKRFVWANRITLGASQSLSGDPSPARFFLGGNDNWYNYRFNQTNYEQDARFSFYSNFVVPFRGWNYFDLTGTRVAVFNSEFRFPFIRQISTVYPRLDLRYINGAVFLDVGSAWSGTDQIRELPLPKRIYGGAGFGCRMNLGMFILRYDRGWPLDVTAFDFYDRPPINYFSLGAEF